ncbi:MAG: glycosyltransferase [Polyangiales bacterium]
MSTLVVTTSWPRTRDLVAGVFVFDDASARAREGVSLIVASPRGEGLALRAERIETIDVPHAGLFGSPGAAVRARAQPWRAVGLVPWRAAIAAIADARRPTALVAHWLVPSALAVTTIASTAPLEAIAHGGDVRALEALPKSMARECIDRIAARARIFRAVSASLAERIATIAPAIARSIVVAPMPLAIDDAETLTRVRLRASALRRSTPRAFAIVVSRLVPTKPVEAAIAAAARAAAHVVVVGDGPDRSKLEARARRRGLDVRFVGALAHEEALAWIAASIYMVVACADGEGAPTVAREAAALGVEASIVEAREGRKYQRGVDALADAAGAGTCASFAPLLRNE